MEVSVFPESTPNGIADTDEALAAGDRRGEVTMLLFLAAESDLSEAFSDLQENVGLLLELQRKRLRYDGSMSASGTSPPSLTTRYNATIREHSGYFLRKLATFGLV